MMQTRRLSPKTEHRLQQSRRINDSATLARKFPKLKSLTVHLSYLRGRNGTANGEMKYKANLEGAKSVFYFNCPNGECVGGDFDLTDELMRAVKAKRKLVTGEMRCLGWHHTVLKEKNACDSVLRYKLTLAY